MAIERSLAYPSLYDSVDIPFLLTSEIFSTIVSVNLPATAPAGQYEVVLGFVYDNPPTIVGGDSVEHQLDGTITGLILSTLDSALLSDDEPVTQSFTFQFTHAGGATTHDYNMRLGAGSLDITIITANISVKRVA